MSVDYKDNLIEGLYRRLDELQRDHNHLWDLLEREGINPERALDKMRYVTVGVFGEDLDD